MLQIVLNHEDDVRSADAIQIRVPLFSLKGTYVGPRLVVTGPKSLLQDLSDRFWEVPGLTRMRGELVFRPEGQDPIYDEPDAVLSLSNRSDDDGAYFRILGRMTALGMISGRGVPQRWVA